MAWTATHVEPNEYDMYPCEGCSSTYITPLAASTCCDPAYDPDLED